MVEVALHQVTAVALGLVMEAALGPVTAVGLGVATVTARGEVIVEGLGPVMVALFGTARVIGFITADAFFSARVLASTVSAIRGGGMGTILTMRVIILIPIRTTAIPIAMRITATDIMGVQTLMATTTMRTMVTHIMGKVMLARPLPGHSKPH